MPREPLVSVVIPSLNCARFIGRALRSLRNQTSRQFEVVVADGGSVDATHEIVASFSNVLDIRTIDVGRGSIGMARNRGIAAARGKYVSFLDADDCYLASRLELAVSALEADSQLDGIFTAFLQYDSKTGGITMGRIYPQRVELREEIFSNSTINLNTLTIRRRSLQERGVSFQEGARGRLGEDWDFAARLAEAGCVVAFSHVPTAVVIKGHASHTTLERQWKMKVSALLTLLRAQRRVPGEREQQSRAIHALLYNTIIVALLSGRPLVARKLMTLDAPRFPLFWLRGLAGVSRVLPRSVQRALLGALVELKALVATYRARAHGVDPALKKEISDLVAHRQGERADVLEQCHDVG